LTPHPGNVWKFVIRKMIVRSKKNAVSQYEKDDENCNLKK